MAVNIYNKVCSEVVRRLNSRIIPVQQMKHAEFAIQFEIDLKSSRKDSNYNLQMYDLSCAVCGLINTSGGIILIDFISSNPERLENWKDSVKGTLVPFTGNDLYMSSIEQVGISDTSLKIHVNQGNRVVAVHTNFHIRDGCSSTEVRQIDLVKHTLENEKKYQYDSTPERWTNLNHGQDAVEQHESSTLEYKYYTCKGVKKLLEKVTTGESGSRLQKTLFAFSNQKGGGTLIIGIQDESQSGRKRVLGQKISQNEQEEFKYEFGKFMTRGIHGEARIWKDEDYEPREGREWILKFIPVKNTPNNESRYLIHIHVNHFPGGVYASMPEMYKVLSDGSFTSVDYDIWKKCITSTEDEHKKYIHKIPKSPSQSTSNQQSGNVNNEVPLLDDVEKYLPQLADELKKWTEKHQNDDQSISWTKHCGIWEKDRQIKKGNSDVPKISELCKTEVLTPRTPISYFPPEKYLLKTDVDGTLKQALEDVSKYYQAKPAVAFADTSLISFFPQIDGIIIPSSHVLDIFVIWQDSTDACGLDVWSICRGAQSSDENSNYLKSLLRQLKRLLLIRSANMAVTITGFVKVLGQTVHSCIETLPAVGEESLDLLQKAIASILLPGIWLKNRFGEEYLVHLTKDQMKEILPPKLAKLSSIDGPPGSGKTLMALTLIENLKKERNLKKNQIKYVCPSQALANYAKSQDLCLVGVCTGKNLIEMIQADKDSGVIVFVFDDGHWIHCTPEQWTELCKIVDKTKGLQVVIFQDSSFQNYGHQNKEMKRAFRAYVDEHRFHYCELTAPQEMLRNSLAIFSFFKANAEEEGEHLEWSHNVLGHDVRIHSHKHSDLKKQSGDNPIIKIVNDLLKNDCHGHFYCECDIVILVGSFILRRRDLIKSIENALQEVLDIYVQRASEVPVKLMVVDSLRNFVGLDSKCCILVLDEDSINDTKLKLFTVSRGIMHVDFILTYDDKRHMHKPERYSATEKMHISQEDMWNKKSMELVQQLHSQLSHHVGMNDRRELSSQQMIPQTPKWKEFVFLLLAKQMDANKKTQHSNKQIQECIKMMIPKAWHLDLYEYQARYLVYGHSEGNSADQNVLRLPAQYPEKLKDLNDLSCGVISSCQSQDVLKTAVKVILVSLGILTKNPPGPMDTAAAVEHQPMSDTHQQVHALEAIDTAMKKSEMITVAMQQGVVDLLMGTLKQADKDDMVKKQVLQVLGTVMKDHNARSQATDRGLVNDLLKILGTQDLDIKESSEGDQERQPESSNGDPAAKMETLDKDQVLHSLITCPVKRLALDVLCKLKEKSTVKTEATDKRVVDGLMEILSQNDTDNLQDALEVLDTVLQNNSMRTLVIQKGVEGVLLGSIKQNMSVSLKLDLLHVLCRVIGEKTDRTKGTDQAVVDCLLDTMRQLVTGDQVEGDALERIQRMMKDSNMTSGVIQQRVLDVLLEITKIHQKNPTVEETVLEVLDKMRKHHTVSTEEIDQVAVLGVLQIIRQHDTDKQVQLDALGVLHTALQTSDMRTAGILPEVIDLLRGVIKQPMKDVAVKKQALQILRTVKENSPSWREKIDRGVIDGLLECLQQQPNDNQIQRDDMQILDTVMKESNEMRTLAIQQGAVDLLLGMIKHPETDDSVKLIVLQVLQSAKEESTAWTEKINQEVVDSLMEILRQHSSSNALIQEESMEVLHTAMEDDNMRTEAIRRGVVNQLLDILKLPGYDEAVKLKHIEVLLTVQKDSTAKTETVYHGIVDGLLDILRQYDTDRWVQEDTLGVMKTVIINSNVLPADIMQEVSDVLLGIVKDTARAVKVQEDTLGVMKTVIINSNVLPADVMQELSEVLLGIVKDTARADQVQREALSMISTGMKYSEMRTALIQQRMVDGLLGIITQHERDYRVQREALRVIDTGMKYSDTRPLLQQGLVDMVLGIFTQVYRHDGVQIDALSMISTGMEYSEMRPALIQEEVVDMLLEIITQGERGVNIVEKALGVIRTVMKYSEMRTALIQQRMVDVLLGIITQGDRNEYVKWDVLLVIDTAMMYSDMRAALLQQGVVDVLLRFIMKGYVRDCVKVKALIALSTLIKNIPAQSQEFGQAVVDHLMEILRKPDIGIWVQRDALEGLDTLMDLTDMRGALLEKGVVDMLLEIITQGDRGVYVKVSALKALCTLIKNSPAQSQEFGQEVVDHLMEILRNPDIKEWVQRDALEGLNKLMDHSEMRSALLEKGVVDVLLRIIMKAGDDKSSVYKKEVRLKVLKEAAEIMCTLASAKVVTHSTIQPVKSLLREFIQVYQDDPDAQKAITSTQSLLAMF